MGGVRKGPSFTFAVRGRFTQAISHRRDAEDAELHGDTLRSSAYSVVRVILKMRLLRPADNWPCHSPHEYDMLNKQRIPNSPQ